MKGRGVVEPNPMVGCVLVKGGDGGGVIGDGHHVRVGGAHAEPTALADCAARGNDPRGATAYVTLEPCCHTNKRTPPCVPALLRAGVARVVLGAIDPNPDVDGKGIAQLRAAGVEVVTGVLEAECRQLLAPFTALTTYRRPYVTLKWAQSADGLIAGQGGARRQISSVEASAVVHRLRARCDAILVGGATVRADDPLLTARAQAPTVDAAGRPVTGPPTTGDTATPPAKRPLLRCVLTAGGAVPRSARLLNTPEAGRVVVYSSSRVTDGASAEVETVVVGGWGEVLRDLAGRGVAHLLVESGGRLAGEMIAAGIADRLWVISSPKPLNEPGVPATSEPDWPVTASRRLGPDTLTERLNPRSEVFFASEPSADLLQLAPA